MMTVRRWLVIPLGLMLILSSGVMLTGATETSGTLILCEAGDGSLSLASTGEECVGTPYEIEGEPWQAEPTATETATATNTPEPTATETPSPTPTATEPPATSLWHPPTDHEHGDAPPAWADTWSQATFGHPVVFGGDEATPNENLHKHEAYKGFLIDFFTTWPYTVDMEIYARLHFQTNPHGRAAQYHSYEIYALDQLTGDISFWQGWLDFGEVPANRFEKPATTLTWALNNTDGDLILGQGAGSTGTEDWYSRNTAAEWSWIIDLRVHDPSTTTDAPAEYTDPTNQSTWIPTGDYGLDRRLGLNFVVEGEEFNHILETRNMENPRGWFCATVFGEITQLSVTGPGDCNPGSLPQYIAPTMPEMPHPVHPSVSKVYPCPACQLPN